MFFRWNPTAGIGNAYFEVSLAVLPGGECETSFAVHRIGSVQDDIHEDLLQLGPIRQNRGQLRTVIPNDFDIVKKKLSFEQFKGRVQETIYILRFHQWLALAGEVE